MGDAVWQNTVISSTNNEYIMCGSSADFDVISGCSLGQKCDKSTYLVNTNSTTQEVSMIRLVDENDQILKTYSSYVPEELVYGNYIFKESSYDAETHTLTRVYRVPYTKTYSFDIPVDSEGHVLYDLEGYTLDHSSDGPSTTENFANGDSITVKYTYRVYKTEGGSGGDDPPSGGDDPATNPSSSDPSSPSGSNHPSSLGTTDIPDTAAHASPVTYIIGFIFVIGGFTVFYKLGLFEFLKKE